MRFSKNNNRLVNRTIIQQQLPEAILQTFENNQIDILSVKQSIKKANAVIIGPGLSTNDFAKQLLILAIDPFPNETTTS